MHTQRAVWIQIVEAGGDYLWFAKGNQPQLEERTLTVSSQLNDFLDWPIYNRYSNWSVALSASKLVKFKSKSCMELPACPEMRFRRNNCSKRSWPIGALKMAYITAAMSLYEKTAPVCPKVIPDVSWPVSTTS